MTIAIGAKFNGGVVVCADTKVVATDGATHHGSKVFLGTNPERMAWAVANAADDGNAAKMLAGELSYAVADAENYGDLIKQLKEKMTEWYSAFGSNKPPALHFLISWGGKGSSSLFFCEPPNTVYSVSHVMPIGQGARPIEPMVDGLFCTIPKFGVRSALLKLAYLMHIAKNQEGSACGGNTTTVVVTDRGTFTFVDGDEMEKAEKFAEKLDEFISTVRKGLLHSFAETPEEKPSIESIFTVSSLSQIYSELSNEAEALAFPSLKFLETGWWERKKLKTQPKLTDKTDEK
jgi:hypothetical protein